MLISQTEFITKLRETSFVKWYCDFLQKPQGSVIYMGLVCFPSYEETDAVLGFEPFRFWLKDVSPLGLLTILCPYILLYSLTVSKK